MAVILVNVIRAPGDVAGEDIVDPLLTTEAAAVERGRVFIDEYYAHKMAVDGTGPFVEWMEPGSLIDIVGHLSPSYKAQLLSFDIQVTRGEEEITADMSVKMERLNND